MMRLLLAAGVCCILAVAQDSTDSILSGLDDLLKTNKGDLNGDSPQTQHQSVNQPYRSAPGGSYQQHPGSGQYGRTNNGYTQNGPQNTGRGRERNPSIHDARDIIAHDDLLSPIGKIDPAIDNAGHKSPRQQIPSRYGRQGPGRQYANRRAQPFHSRYTPNEPIPDKASYIRQPSNRVPRYQSVPNQPQHPSAPDNSYGKPYQQRSVPPHSGQRYNENTPRQGPVYISDQKPRYGTNARSNRNPAPPVPAFGVPPTRPHQFVAPHQIQHPIDNSNHRNVPYSQSNPQPYAIRNNQQQLYHGAQNRDQRYPANNRRERPNYQGSNQGQTQQVYQPNSNRGNLARHQSPVYPGSHGQNRINQYSNPGPRPQRDQYNQPSQVPHRNQPNGYNQAPHPQLQPHNQANQFVSPNQPIQQRYPGPSVNSKQSPVQYTGSNDPVHRKPNQPQGYGQADPVQQHPSNQYHPSDKPHEDQQQPSVYSPVVTQSAEYPPKPASQTPSDDVYPPAKQTHNEQDPYNQPRSDGYRQPKIPKSHNDQINPYQPKDNSGDQSEYHARNQYPGNNADHNDETPKYQPTDFDHSPEHSPAASVYKPTEHQDPAPSYGQSEHGPHRDNAPVDKQATPKTGGTYADDIYPRAYPDTEDKGASADHPLSHPHPDGNHISHDGASDYPDLYPAKETHKDPATGSYPSVDTSGVYPPGNGGTKKKEIAKPSHVSLAQPTAGNHDYSDIYPDTTQHKEPSIGTHSGKGTHSNVKDDFYPIPTNHVDHDDSYPSKVSEATHDPYPVHSDSDKDAISYLESETPKTNDHLVGHGGHSNQHYPEIYPDTKNKDGNTKSYPPKSEGTKPHTEPYTSPQNSGSSIDTHPETYNVKQDTHPQQHPHDDIYSKNKHSDGNIYPQAKDSKSPKGVYPQTIDSAYQPVHQSPAAHQPSKHVNHHSKFPRNRYPQAGHSKFLQNQYPHAEKPKPVVHVTKVDPSPRQIPKANHVVQHTVTNAAHKPAITRDLNPTPTFIPPGLQGHCYKYKDLSAAYKLSDHSFGYPEDAVTEELRREPFLAPILGFKNFAQPRKQEDIFGLGGNTQASTNNDHLIAKNIYPTGYKEGDFETPVPRDVSCRTSTHSLRMFKLDGGHCWTVNPDHNKVSFKHCSAPGDYCSSCGVGGPGGGSRGRCSEDYEWVEVWSYCDKSPPGERVRPRRLYLPTGCSCKTYYC